MIDSPLVIVSNRQPYRHEYRDEADEDEVTVDRPGGGVVAGLDAVAREHGGTWIAWGDGDADAVVSDELGRVAVPPEEERYTLRRVWLEAADVAGYYEGYANRVLWPLCHTATGAITCKPEYWRRYRDVNARFAEEVVAEATEDSIVWFQDYHLALAPKLVRDSLSGVLAHFWHIPWPSEDVYRICPQRRELLEGLLANDLIGFHIDQYSEHFLDCVATFLPEASIDRDECLVRYEGHTTRVGTFPLGVDVADIREKAANGSSIERTLRQKHRISGQVVLGVDRLDYSKGIPERLAALDHLWTKCPELRGKFTYVQKGTASREGIPEYRELQSEVDRRIERINGRFGTEQWSPVVRISSFLSEEELYGLYRSADVMLVTPLRDGMNLVSQEYVASQLERDGVLVLSEFAGGHDHLGDSAISVNPYDTEGLAAAIESAVSMNTLERNRRMRALNSVVEDLDISGWVASMLESATTDTPDATTPTRTVE